MDFGSTPPSNKQMTKTKCWWVVDVCVQGTRYGKFLTFAEDGTEAKEYIGDYEPKAFKGRYTTAEFSVWKFEGPTDQLKEGAYYPYAPRPLPSNTEVEIEVEVGADGVARYRDFEAEYQEWKRTHGWKATLQNGFVLPKTD